MLIAALSMMLQTTAPPAAGAEQKAPDRLAQCIAIAQEIPADGEVAANFWRGEDGGYRARVCLGVAYTNQGRFTEAARAFTEAAGEAEAAKDSAAADYWARAGNAQLAAGEPNAALAALDTAIGAGTLVGNPLGEAHLDRARARVALSDDAGARADLDLATRFAPEDPLSWLLSATLARRMGDKVRSASDIREAVARAPDSPPVQLEAGNIAAVAGDENGARAAWNRVVTVAPESREANAARAALAQFGD